MNTTGLLRELRNRGLTQSAISKRTGIPQPRLSRWEGGDVPASADDALLLKALLDEVTPISTSEAAGACVTSNEL